MRPSFTRIWTDERGLTLVELIVALSLMLATFAAIMMFFQVFQRDAANSSARNNALSQARLAADRIVHDLRNVASSRTTPTLIERAKSYDLVFQTVGTPSGSNTAGIQRVRYCVPDDTSGGSTAQEVLIRQTQTWTTSTAPANPWPQSTATIACPDASAPSATLVNFLTSRYKQRTDRPVFVYNGGTAPSSLASITSIGILMFVNPSPTMSSAEAEIQSAAFLRNQNRAPTAAFTYAAPGGGHVLLNATATDDPDGQHVNYQWTCSPSTCTGSGATQEIFDWKPTGGAGTYTVTLTATDSGGLASTVTQSVVVR